MSCHITTQRRKLNNSRYPESWAQHSCQCSLFQCSGTRFRCSRTKQVIGPYLVTMLLHTASHRTIAGTLESPVITCRHRLLKSLLVLYAEHSAHMVWWNVPFQQDSFPRSLGNRYDNADDVNMNSGQCWNGNLLFAHPWCISMAITFYLRIGKCVLVTF